MRRMDVVNQRRRFGLTDLSGNHAHSWRFRISRRFSPIEEDEPARVRLVGE
jgi:hypothetical protein